MRTLLVALLLAGVSLLGTPNSARCAWCTTAPYTASFCRPCLCMTGGLGQAGRCVSLQRGEKP
jgi:hypothetical protein